MCYFSNALQYPQITVNAICHSLNDPKFGRVDLIVGTGVSGLMVLTPVSMLSGIPCGAVRKPIDANHDSLEGGSHSDSMVETFIPPGHFVDRYVIIDDLTESGSTIDRIISTMRRSMNAECNGVILYQNYIGDPKEFYRGIPVANLGDDIKTIANQNGSLHHGRDIS